MSYLISDTYCYDCNMPGPIKVIDRADVFTNAIMHLISFLIILGFIIIGLSIIYKACCLIGRCLVLKKAGEKWWKGLIPIYGKFSLFHLFKMDIEFCCWIVLIALATVINIDWLSILLFAVSSMIMYLVYYKICTCLGHGLKMFFFLVLCRPIAWLYLGFNKDEFIFDRLETLGPELNKHIELKKKEETNNVKKEDDENNKVDNNIVEKKKRKTSTKKEVDKKTDKVKNKKTANKKTK